jgi:CelD/BcsL family acetyltransferase involved in cellulose biosynthesis
VKVGGGEVAWWLGGFDDAWASIHPSLQALATAIEDGMRRGEDRFDLGSGAQPFKYRFADAEDRLDWIRLYPPAGRRPLTLAAQAPAAVRRRISVRLSKRLKERLRPAAPRLPWRPR